MSDFFILLTGFSVAVLMLKYRGQIHDFVGDISFAERYLGRGGTNTFIVLLAILVFAFSLMYVLGTFDSIFISIVGPLFGLG